MPYETSSGVVSMMSAPSGNQTSAARELGVPMAMTMIDKHLSELHATCEEVERRLSTVLLPDQPETANKSIDPPVSIRAPHVDMLRHVDSGLSAAIGRLSRLMQRLDL